MEEEARNTEHLPYSCKLQYNWTWSKIVEISSWIVVLSYISYQGVEYLDKQVIGSVYL